MKFVNTFFSTIQNVVGTKILEQTLYNKLAFENRKQMLIEHILNDSQKGITTDRYCNHNIIVSLTTFGKRINDVAFTIESIMQQTMKANKIILWIDESFREKVLPQSLINQQKRGLDIAYCKDIRSYTKLIYALKQYPNDAIITIDDDLMYEFDMIEHLITAYLRAPQYIHSCRTHRILLDNNNKVLPYNKWMQRIKDMGPDRLNFATGVGGVLYPPNSLDNEVFNENVFLDICKYADDIWFFTMALKKGTFINKVYTRDPGGNDYITNEGVQDVGLKNINTSGEMLNDIQFRSVFEKYKLYDNIKLCHQ